MFIYLDESGDLGFDFGKPKTSKKFVITLLVCRNQEAQRKFQKAVRRTLRKKLNKKRRGQVTELKGTRTTLAIKQYFFRGVTEGSWQIYSVVLNKERVYSYLQSKDSKPKLYNFLTRFLLEKLPLRQTFANVRLVVDRSKNRREIRDFNQYLRNQIEGLLPLNTGFQVEHRSSQEDPCLQSADLFCWGIFRKYEYGDSQWFDVYSKKIAYVEEYLPNQAHEKMRTLQCRASSGSWPTDGREHLRHIAGLTRTYNISENPRKNMKNIEKLRRKSWKNQEKRLRENLQNYVSPH